MFSRKIVCREFCIIFHHLRLSCISFHMFEICFSCFSSPLSPFHMTSIIAQHISQSKSSSVLSQLPLKCSELCDCWMKMESNGKSWWMLQFAINTIVQATLQNTIMEFTYRNVIVRNLSEFHKFSRCQCKLQWLKFQTGDNTSALKGCSYCSCLV